MACIKLVITCAAALAVLMTVPTSALYSPRAAAYSKLRTGYSRTVSPYSTPIGIRRHYGASRLFGSRHSGSKYGHGHRNSQTFVPAGSIGYNSYKLEKLKSQGAAFLSYKQRTAEAIHHLAEVQGHGLLGRQFGPYAGHFPLSTLGAVGYGGPFGTEQLAYLEGLQTGAAAAALHAHPAVPYTPSLF